MKRLTGRALLIAWAGAAAVPALSGAQAPVYRAGWSAWAVAAGAGGFAALPELLHLPRGAPPCAPCDPAGLPGIDRWVVGHASRSAGTGSNVLLLGVAGGALLASVSGLPAERARGNAAMGVNAFALASLATEWTKALVHRSRPVLYTAQAPSAAGDRDNRRSFPSGHTAAAFAVAMSYAVMAHRQHLPHATRNDVLLFAGAAGVGALRVAAGRHFVTDVIGGAVVGAGVGWLTARLYPTRP
jgi:membrane-associated phospholipid phosphatase